jgi:hypothetical protein
MFFSPDNRPPSTRDNENQSRNQIDLEFGSEEIHQRNHVFCPHTLHFLFRTSFRLLEHSIQVFHGIWKNQLCDPDSKFNSSSQPERRIVCISFGGVGCYSCWKLRIEYPKSCWTLPHIIEGSIPRTFVTPCPKIPDWAYFLQVFSRVGCSSSC